MRSIPRPCLRSAAIAAILLLAACGPAGGGAKPPRLEVFAAASLTDALREIGSACEAATGRAARFSFASSAALAHQIEQGAPAQIFASADERWMDELADRGLIEIGSRVSPLGNELVLIAPAARPRPPVDLGTRIDGAALLGPGDRLAVGDPAHVPAGRYAEEALESLGLRAALEPRLAFTDDVRAALALVERGEAALGIVYRTDAAIAPDVVVVGRFPRGSHSPITYSFAIVKGADAPGVRAWFDCVTGPTARPIFEHMGFAWRSDP